MLIKRNQTRVWLCLKTFSLPIFRALLLLNFKFFKFKASDERETGKLYAVGFQSRPDWIRRPDTSTAARQQAAGTAFPAENKLLDAQEKNVNDVQSLTLRVPYAPTH